MHHQLLRLMLFVIACASAASVSGEGTLGPGDGGFDRNVFDDGDKFKVDEERFHRNVFDDVEKLDVDKESFDRDVFDVERGGEP